MRKNPHVRICGGLGSATTLVYPTAKRWPEPVMRVYPDFPTPFWGLSVFFVGDLMGKACLGA